jgi:hypothetical protein
MWTSAMSVMPRRASAAWNAGACLIRSPSAANSALVTGGCAPGTGTALVTRAGASSTTVTSHVSRLGFSYTTHNTSRGTARPSSQPNTAALAGSASAQ